MGGMVEADSANGTAPANYRGMLALVIFLGILIVLALGALIGGAIMGAGPASRTDGGPYLTSLPASPGAQIGDAQLDGPRLILRLEGGGEGGGEVVILEAATGRVIGRVALEQAP